MPVAGKLEVIIKINELPDSKVVENGWKAFEIDCEGKVISMTVKPKIWNKLEQANKDFPQWVAAIAGRMGKPTKNGFVLDQPNIQVFERKPKETKDEGQADAEKPPAPAESAKR